MKQFHSKLDKFYEGLHLKKTYIPETEKPDFKSIDNPYTLNFLLHKVYTMIELTLKAGRNEDFSDKEKLDDYERLFKDVLHTIESSYKGAPRATFTPETKTAPDGHYYTKTGNLVKGRLSKDAEERGARLSDPKDKQRSKTPSVSQYNEEIGGRGTITIVDGRDGERKLLYTIDGSKEYEVGGIDFKNLTTGDIVTSNERIHTQLSRAIRFNPDFQEDGQPKYDVTSAATRASRDAGGPMTEVGDFKVSILWNQEERKPLEVGESWNFKLVPEPIKK